MRKIVPVAFVLPLNARPEKNDGDIVHPMISSFNSSLIRRMGVFMPFNLDARKTSGSSA
jgi:hypothetical protein